MLLIVVEDLAGRRKWLKISKKGKPVNPKIRAEVTRLDTNSFLVKQNARGLHTLLYDYRWRKNFKVYKVEELTKRDLELMFLDEL